MNGWRRRLIGNPSRSIAPLAWWLIPLFLFIGILIYFFGDFDGARSGLLDMHRAPSGEQVWLGDSNIPDQSWSESFVAPSEEVRARLLQNLSRFRGERVQQGIELEILASAETGHQVAQQLGSALGHYGMGKATRRSGEASAVPFTTLRAAPRDRGMARELLAALSPYLKGDIWIQYDESVNTRTMTLLLADDPLFGHDGTVWYGLD